MKDINCMKLKDFHGVLGFADRRAKMMSGKPVSLKSEQKDMIKRAKENMNKK